MSGEHRAQTRHLPVECGELTARPNATRVTGAANNFIMHRSAILPPTPLFLVAFTLSLFTAMPASANSSTPMIMSSFGWLAIVNPIIGVVEGLLVSWAFKTPKRRTIGLLIGANYASAFVGGLMSRVVAEVLLQQFSELPNIDAVLRTSIAMYVVALVVSAVVEWPIISIALQPGPRRARRAMLASVASQVVSYIGLAAWYSDVANISVYTNYARVDASVVAPRDLDAAVYYILPSDGSVWKVNLDGTRRQRIADLGLTDDDDLLVPYQNKSGGFDLWAVSLDHIGDEVRECRLVVAGFADQSAVQSPPYEHMAFDPLGVAVGARHTVGAAADLRRGQTRQWEFFTTRYSHLGVVARRVPAGWHQYIGFAVPAIPNELHAAYATVLPGDLLVYQIGRLDDLRGNESILLVDVETSRIALLAVGRSPVVGIRR